MLGREVGPRVGEADGLTVRVGEADGLTVGEADGLAVGKADGLAMGEADGITVREGEAVGGHSSSETSSSLIVSLALNSGIRPWKKFLPALHDI